MNEDQQNQNQISNNMICDGNNDELQKSNVTSDIVSALDDEDEDEDALVARLPNNTTDLQSCITAAQGCLLLLVLKQHLKDTYGLSDG